MQTPIILQIVTICLQSNLKSEDSKLPADKSLYILQIEQTMPPIAHHYK